MIQDIADGKSYTLDDILKLHGEFLRDAKYKDFDHFAAILIETEELPQVYPPKPENLPDISQDVKPKTPAFKIHEGR